MPSGTIFKVVQKSPTYIFVMKLFNISRKGTRDKVEQVARRLSFCEKLSKKS